MGAQPRLSSTGRALVGGRTGAARACFQSAACCCAAGWQPFVDAVYARISPSIFIQAWDCDCARRDGPLARRGLVCFCWPGLRRAPHIALPLSVILPLLALIGLQTAQTNRLFLLLLPALSILAA